MDWDGQGICPGIPELVIEIISPSQSFGGMTGKATDYLLAGVNKVWVVDNQAQSVTVFGNNELPQTLWIDDTMSHPLLSELAIALLIYSHQGDFPMLTKIIEIPAPQFDLYEFVTLYWNEQEQRVKVVRRWFDLDDNQWWYKIQNSGVLYPEKAFSVVEVVP